MADGTVAVATVTYHLAPTYYLVAPKRGSTHIITAGQPDLTKVML